MCVIVLILSIFKTIYMSLISLFTPLSIFWKSYIRHNPQPWKLSSLFEAMMCYNLLYMQTITPTSFFSSCGHQI
jgi:hypothetical protein